MGILDYIFNSPSKRNQEVEGDDFEEDVYYDLDNLVPRQSYPDNSTSIAPEHSSDSGESLKNFLYQHRVPIAICAIAIFVVVLAVTLLIVYICCKKRRNPSSPEVISMQPLPSISATTTATTFSKESDEVFVLDNTSIYRKK